MQVRWHVAASLTGAMLVWGITHSAYAVMASVVGGCLIDLDHLLEYVRVRRAWTLKDFFEFWDNFHEAHLYLWLHSWEFIAVLGLMAVGGVIPWLCGGLCFGAAHHMLLDNIGNPIQPRAFWLVYRWRVGFASERVLKETYWNKFYLGDVFRK